MERHPRRGSVVVLVILVILALVAVHAPGRAQSPAAAPSPNPNVEEKAVAAFTRMATSLSQMPKLAVTIVSGYDAVQEDGIKVEFGETRQWTLRRPDRVRIDTETREGSKRGFRFDGTTIGVFDDAQKVYATVEHAGTMEQAFNYFIDRLQMPIPFSELFSSNLPKFVRNLELLEHVDESTIAGVRCDHLVGATASIDFQVWIAQDATALPQRLILTYKLAEGEPQRWADFQRWNLAPDVPDALFAFTPPAGFEKIPFEVQEQAAEKPAAAPQAPQKKGAGQ